MKKIKCLTCNEIWYIEDDQTEKQCVCPYCGKDLKKKIDKFSLDAIDTLDKIIFSAISQYGLEIIKNSGKITSFLMDMAGDTADLKKDVRIFSKALNVYGDDIYVIFLNNKPFEEKLKKLRYSLMEDEGMSDVWADKICSVIVESKKRLNNKTDYILAVEIEELSFNNHDKSINFPEIFYDLHTTDMEKIRKLNECGIEIDEKVLKKMLAKENKNKKIYPSKTFYVSMNIKRDKAIISTYF